MYWSPTFHSKRIKKNTYTISNAPSSHISSDNESDFPDCSLYFKNNQVFESREAAETWVRDIGRANNIFFTISHSKPRHVYMGCERGGNYRNTISNNPDVKVRNAIGSKKNNCPFEVKLHERFQGAWRVYVREGHEKHNHELGNYPHGHTSVTKLTPEKFARVVELLQCGMAPRQILSQLKKDFPGTCSNLRHIYNADQKHQRTEMGSLAPIAYFQELLRRNHYIYTYSTVDGTNTMEGMFLAHPNTRELIRLFPQVVVMDATYKTNLYDMPLVELVGVLPTGQNYHIAFIFLSNERTTSYIWGLIQLRVLFAECGVSPGVFVTDRELAEINAIKLVFPEAAHLLCRRHISKDVQFNLCKMVGKQYKPMIKSRWNHLVHADTEELYEQAVAEMAEAWHRHPGCMAYIRNQWLDPFRDRFVQAWTKNILHYGCNTTNR